ncbi:unnamed protein product [Alopecurus aequalis]
MGTLNVTVLLCLLLLMPLHLVPGSEAGTCKEMSRTYTTRACVEDVCGEACSKEGFTKGLCEIVFQRRKLGLRCFCAKEC